MLHKRVHGDEHSPEFKNDVSSYKHIPNESDSIPSVFSAESLLIPVPSIHNHHNASVLLTEGENQALNFAPLESHYPVEVEKKEKGTHRAACHRCGNMRKSIFPCTNCPNIYCKKCTELVVSEYGTSAFDGGCPKCKELCCCGKNKTVDCTRTNHCYRKCPSTKPKKEKKEKLLHYGGDNTMPLGYSSSSLPQPLEDHSHLMIPMPMPMPTIDQQVAMQDHQNAQQHML